MSKQVGILGCGWLGKALAKSLVKKNYTVKGTTTSLGKLEDLQNIGADIFQIELKPSSVKGNFEEFLKDLNVLIIAIPPQLRNGENKFYKALQFLFNQYDFSVLDKLIYVSSTGVFADGINAKYNEHSAPNNDSFRGQSLRDLETLVRSQKQIKTKIVLRYGGLIEHGGRHPVHYLSGKKDIDNPDAPVNLIEQTDAVNLLVKIIEQHNALLFYHGVYPEHPSREDYYTKTAKSLNIKPPEFSHFKASIGRLVSSEFTMESLDFKFSSRI